MQDLFKLSVLEASEALASHAITSVDLVRSCLKRIEDRESSVRAWAYLDPRRAMEEARMRDSEPRRGLLHGIPIGLKDIIDTKDMPTGYGSRIFADHIPAIDAACVNLLRRAGCVIMGKTVTTEFGMFQPNKTRNPHDPSHTPGGSSSGSAAAVADFHVPMALATQTSGSTIRPAAFCGAVGYKATFNTFSLFGVRPQAHSLDTLGIMTRSAHDLKLAWDVLQGASASHAPTEPLVPKNRIGWCRTPFWDQADDAQKAMFTKILGYLKERGETLEEVALPASFEGLNECHGQLMAYEAARNFLHEYEGGQQGLLGNLTRESIASGWRVSPARYLEIRRIVRSAQSEFERLAAPFDALIVPAAPGEAPPIATTGDSVFNRMWSLLGVPAITLPAGRGPRNLPVGIQLVGGPDSDLALMNCCCRLEGLLEPAAA